MYIKAMYMVLVLIMCATAAVYMAWGMKHYSACSSRAPPVLMPHYSYSFATRATTIHSYSTSMRRCTTLST